MFRSLRKRLLHALQPYRLNSNTYVADAVLMVPGAITADAPLWSPGPNYVEVTTASRWATRTDSGQLHAVARSTAKATDDPVLISGVVSGADLLGLGGICDKPHRLRWMAQPGTFTEEILPNQHPALVYERWIDALENDAKNRAEAADLPPWCRSLFWPQRRLDGRFHITLHLDVDRDHFWYELDELARALTRLADSYRHHTAIRFYPYRSDHVTEPLYTAAWSALSITRDDMSSRD